MYCDLRLKKMPPYRPVDEFWNERMKDAEFVAPLHELHVGQVSYLSLDWTAGKKPALHTSSYSRCGSSAAA